MHTEVQQEEFAMLDPSSPWLAAGYKKVLPQDYCSKYSTSKSASLDDFNYSLHSPDNRVSEQRCRVKSAIVSGRYRQQPKPPINQKNTYYRPKSASQINQYRENLGSIYTHVADCENTRYHDLPRRAKSATHLRHRSAGLQNKSVTEVERLHHSRLMVSSIPVGRTTDHKPCAYCPVECRPKSSSSQRPISSTGLLTASVPSHFDRSKFWAKGITRPRTAPTSRREFLHLPRYNFIQRGSVPHYTHFIKSLNLFPRDGSPLPHPTPPVILIQDDVDPFISSQFGGSSMVGDDDTSGRSPSDLDDSDWEDIEDEDPTQEDATPMEDPENKLPDGYDDDFEPTANRDIDQSDTEDKEVHKEPLKLVRMTPSPPVIIPHSNEQEDADEELERLTINEENGGQEEKLIPSAPSPSPVTIQAEDNSLVTDDGPRKYQDGESAEESKTEESIGHQSEILLSITKELIKDEDRTSLVEQEDVKIKGKCTVRDIPVMKEEKVKPGKSQISEVKVKLREKGDGLKPSITMIPTPPVKQHSTTSHRLHQTRPTKGKKDRTVKAKKQKKVVRIKEPGWLEPFKSGDAESGHAKKDAWQTVREKPNTSVNKMLRKEVRVPATPQIILPEHDKSVKFEEILSATELAGIAYRKGKTCQDSEEDQKDSKIKFGSPPNTKVDLPGMDVDTMKEILDLEMRLRRKGPGSNQSSETDESLTVSIDHGPNIIPAGQNKKFIPVPWNCCRVALSRRAGRFEMPIDMEELVGMTPVEYLLKYCKVNPQRKALYKRIFAKIDKDCDGRISRKELNQAVTEALVDTVNDGQVASVLESVGINKDDTSVMVKFSFFAPFCALLERLYYSIFVTEDSSDRDARFKERIEDVDFSALDWKLDSYEINEDLRKLLYSL